MTAEANTFSELIAAFHSGRLCPVEYTESLISRIKSQNPSVRAFISLTETTARRAARRSQQLLKSGCSPRPLEGIPVALKDVIDVAGSITTGGTVFPGAMPAVKNARVVDLLELAGAVVIGKANMDELALGQTTDNRHFGRCLNPLNVEFIPGGSSGGSAAAIAAAMSLGSLGGDSGGSIRSPAALHGLVGLKPTNGVIDRDGILTGTWTLDSCGPLTRNVDDCFTLLSVLCPDLLVTQRAGDIQSGEVTIGIPKQYYFDKLDNDVARCFQDGAKAIERLGCKFIEVDTPNASLAVDAGAIISWSEFSVSLAPFLETSDGSYLSPRVRNLLNAASTHLASEYIAAQQVRAVIIAEHAEIWTRVDAIMMPTMPVRAPRVGAADTTRVGAYTRIACLTGEPAVSVPVGVDMNNMPVGIQLIGPRFSETRLLSIAKLLEKGIAGTRAI